MVRSQRNNIRPKLAIYTAFAALLALLAVAVSVQAGSIFVEEVNTNVALVEYPAGPQNDATLQVYITNNDPAKTINQVRFEYDIAFAPDDDVSLDWALGRSKAKDWAVSVSNKDPIRVVQFATTANTDTSGMIRPNEDRLFQVGFRLNEHAAQKDELPIRVKATYTDKTTATAYSFDLYTDTTGPKVLAGTQGAGIVTRDSDANGRLDQIHVVFDDRLDEESFVLNEWVIDSGAREITKAAFKRIAPGADISDNPLEDFGTCPAASTTGPVRWGCHRVILFLVEGQEPDTGALPTVTFAGKELSDLAGNPAASISSGKVRDGAPPVVVSALAFSDDPLATDFENVLLKFSEPVKGSGTNGLVSAADLEYTDTSLGVANEDPANPGVVEVKEILHPAPNAGVLGKATVLLVLKTNLTTDDVSSGDAATAIADVIDCENTIKDLAKEGPAKGGHLCLPNEVPILTPNVLEAAANIGSKEIILRFNTPVEAINGGAINNGLSFKSTTGGGPSGIINYQHKRCTSEVVLTTDRPVKPTDVDKTAAQIQIQTNEIRGCSIGGGVPFVIPAQGVDLQDLTEPKLESARTVDRDNNGVIDGFHVEFSEPVRDVTFCDGQNPCPNDNGANQLIRIVDTSGQNNLALYGPFKWETGQTDDASGIITWPQNNPLSASALDTGFIPDLRIEAGLFEDLVPPGSNNPANLMLPVTSEDIKETDSAKPVVLSASTLDAETIDRTKEIGKQFDCLLEVEATCEENPDGFIDTYIIKFSEPINDETFHAAEWTVEGRKILGNWSANRGSNADNDNTLAIRFEEYKENQFPSNRTGGWDTDEVPELAYKFLPALGGLADLHGNRLADFAFDDVKLKEKDGARPVIVGAEGFIDDNRLWIYFSEPVDDGDDGGLVHTDFNYLNNNFRAFPNGAAGIVNSPQVKHEAGDDVALVYLNAPLLAEDIQFDNVSAVYSQVSGSGAIWEISPKADPPQNVLGTRKPLAKARDVTPPGPVADLGQVFVQPNIVALNWTAPGDDGPDNGTVSGYYVKLAKGSFSYGSWLEVLENDLPENVSIVHFSPPVIETRAGLQQVVLLDGLEPATKYYASIKAYDEEGLVSQTGSVFEFTTHRDETPPNLSDSGFGLTVDGLSNDGTIKKNKFTVRWNAMDDPESTVLYRYIISKDPNTLPDQGTPGTTETSVEVTVPEPGVWWITVQGFSGVPGPFSPLRVEVLHPDVDSVAAEAYNLELNAPEDGERHLGIRYSKAGNQLNWSLPSDPPGEVAKIRVWRLNDGAYEQVGEVNGDFSQLSTGGFLDPDGTRKDIYYVDVGYAGGSSAGDPNPLVHEGTPVENSALIPWWAWILIVVGSLLIIGAIVLVVVLKVKSGSRADPAAQEGWSSVEDDGPIHDVDCPQCGHDFQAQGILPLAIECPECGVSGKLE